MKRLNLLIKPSSLCNLRCTYCFYRDVSTRRTDTSSGNMHMDTMEAIVRNAFLTAYDLVEFSFQGGEPTLVGLKFYENFIELVKKYNTKGTPVLYTIQTNGINIDEQWALFFRTNEFLAGLSIDGTNDLHDRNRQDIDGKGTYRRCHNALKLLRKSGTEVNALCVVTNQISSKAQSIYENLKKEGFLYIQFIPCLDPYDAEGKNAGNLLRPEKYAIFLKTIFDLWYLDWENGNYISIRSFDDYVHILAGHPTSSCAASGTCGSYLTVESDGGVYPCDFYTVDRWHLGNIKEMTLIELFQNEKNICFIEESRAIPVKCRCCKYLMLCGCGCKRYRAGTEGLNIYCSAYAEFFDYSIERLKLIASLERLISISEKAAFHQ